MDSEASTVSRLRARLPSSWLAWLLLAPSVAGLAVVVLLAVPTLALALLVAIRALLRAW